MTQEDYCSYELSQLLKEKGMNKSCFNHYVQKNNNDGTSEAVAVCTQQMAMKWLREVHHIYIGIFPTHNILSDSIDYEWQTYNASYDFTVDSDAFFNIYEEAVEAAIKYSLENLI